MTEQKWEQIISMIEDKFGIEKRDQWKLDPVGEVDCIEFKCPTGKMKLERIVKPKLIDKKTTYSRRIGGDVKVDYIYSEDEFVSTLKAYRYDEAKEGWVDFEIENFGV